ncbi:uncharacterized protein LOC113380998, partial [Ctenocephalides felis]|uniref:uncharacterized protein LOC113380998 n=1 Tax=Ctenocephalides felis TaxID=7515 RepID=UPI000E6E2B59
MESKKKLSGAQFRKRKAVKEADIQKQAGTLSNFIKKIKKSDTGCSEVDLEEISVIEPCSSTSFSNDCSIPQHDSSESQRLDLNVVADETEETVIIKNLEDPAEWGIIDGKLRVELVEMGPIQKKNIIYPKDTHGRKFNYSYYNRKMENGELVPRTWLIYSEKLDRVFCFCCKLFASNETNSFLDGYSDWRNLSTSLHRHETNLTHMRNFLQWKDLDKSLKNKTTIDYQTQSLYEMEKRHWRSALERIIEIIKFLASQNIAFRGSSDKLYESNNGNFLKLIELFAKFDPVIENHIHRALQPNNKVHYLSKKSQNEQLEILSKAIRDKILLSLRKSKYYSIILDCTPDASKTEQMIIIVRFVSFENEVVKIRENFLGFVDITDSTGRGLCSTIIDNLKKWNIPIEDMRGPGYDNGANMKGKNNGLQKLLLTKNPRAFFVPCAAHTLNLMINDAAKQPSDTRWESRINAIRPLRYQLGEVYDALFDIVNNENFNKEIQHEAQALESIENLKIFMQDYRSELKFEDVLKTAKELSEEVDGEQEFKSSSEVRQRKKKRQFDYEQHDESPRSPQEKFKISVFYTLLDVVYKPSLWYFNSLQFLEAYVTPRKSRKSFEPLVQLQESQSS